MLAQSSGYDALDSAALRAAAGYRFEPARLQGRAVGADVLLPFNFELRTLGRR
jgi:TonB family protein